MSLKRQEMSPGNMAWLVMDRLGQLLDLPFRAIQRLGGLRLMPYVFLVPNLGFFGLFVVIPLFVNFAFSFTGGVNLFLGDRVYTGVEQYEFLFTCDRFLDSASCREDRFWRGIYNTLFFVTFQVFFLVVFFTGHGIDPEPEDSRPRVLSGGYISSRCCFRRWWWPLVWKWILLRDGILNAFLVSLGLDKILFFVSPEWAMFWAIFVSIWAHMGFYTLILLAGLQAIPPELNEAAEMDGTRRERVFWRITLPLLWPNMLVVIVLALIKGVQIFDEVFVLTGGGPGTATQFIVQYIYNTGFSNQVQNFGLASAASVVLGILLFALTLAQLAVVRRRDRGNG